MVDLIVVIDEAIGITETVAPATLDVSAQLSTFKADIDFNDPPSMLLVVADIPPLTDDCCQEPLWYAFAIADTKSNEAVSGFIEVSYDGGSSWSKRADYTGESVLAYVDPDASTDRNLGTALPDRWDVYSQVTVRVLNEDAAFVSASREAVLAGANQLLIRGEIRAFSTAVETTTDPQAGRVFVLTDWIRGMRGTTIIDPHFVGNGSNFVIVADLTSPFVRVQIPVGDDDVLLRYRARDERTPATLDTGVQFTVLGVNQQPLPVADPTSTQQVNDDWIITWSPVSRIPCPQILAARDVPDPDTATYEARILDAPGGAVVRTITVTDAEFAVYLSAWQTEDFGSPQSVIYVEIVRTSTWLDSDGVEI